ncbi:contact-dependent growth inhibition system immunity protein [Streptomyces sp. NPDC079167]|uniref:contact-dependent growth inhibition system immunity protein n=1 Tax=Streptomyces sp. NPDC079167 TaxID=3154513 RepID=UPI00341BCE77
MHERTLEQLEGAVWPDPPPRSTGLARAVHALRRRPVGELTPHEPARLIGQQVSLPWLLPSAVRHLHETAPGQATGGFYDDDLLTAVLAVSPEIWSAEPELARGLRDALGSLADLGPHLTEAAEDFLRANP